MVVQDRAYEISQKYKEGRYILEKNLLCQAEATDWDAGGQLIVLTH